jgi:hypothetical protein
MDMQKLFLSLKLLLTQDIYDSMVINSQCSISKKSFRPRLQNLLIGDGLSQSTSCLEKVFGKAAQKPGKIQKPKFLPKIDTNAVYNALEESWRECEPELEEITNKWFRQTSIGDNDTSLAKKIQHLNKPPFQKVREILEVPKELIRKSRLRVSGLKIIGETVNPNAPKPKILNNLLGSARPR